MTITNWKDKLIEALDDEELLAINIEGTLYLPYDLDDGLARLSHEFDDDYGTPLGESFWAWSYDYVFFCLVAEGHEWIEKVPRHSSLDDVPRHFGEE
ncbi:MAG: hypothetical protein U9N01_04315 [Euryarchaeota archaeon]|nr:hypothetical protein [Euryarchaeota archaeon]